MTEYIVATFDTPAHAKAAEDALRVSGIAANMIEHYGPSWRTMYGAGDHAAFEQHASFGGSALRVQTMDNHQAMNVVRVLEAYQPDVVNASQASTGTVNTIPQTTEAEQDVARNHALSSPLPGTSDREQPAPAKTVTAPMPGAANAGIVHTTGTAPAGTEPVYVQTSGGRQRIHRFVVK